MHSLFEEQIREPSWGQLAVYERGMPEFTGTSAHFPRPDTFPLDPHEYLEQIRRIKAAVSIPVIGSLNGAGADGWLAFAPLIEQAGANALELNVYYVSTDFSESAGGIEDRIETFVRTLKSLVRIPVAVKLTPFYTAFAGFAARLAAAGADGLVLFNRFYQSDIDVESLELLPNLRLSTPADLLLRLHWLAALHGRLQTSLVATGGVHTALDGIKALLSGAHSVALVSAVLQQGPQHFRTMQDGLRYWMSRRGFDSIDAFRGRASLASRPNPADFERSNYQAVLRAWSR
jgi:dihydroorotate dehydrogenase (fumarate)